MAGHLFAFLSCAGRRRALVIVALSLACLSGCQRYQVNPVNPSWPLRYEQPPQPVPPPESRRSLSSPLSGVVANSVDTSKLICKAYSLSDLGADPQLCRWIVDTIPQTIEPASWKGGTGKLSYYAPGQVLIVQQTPEVHAKLGAFLQDIKKAIPEPQATPAQADPNTPKHLAHFIIRYEGDGVIDANVVKLAKALKEEVRANPSVSKIEPEYELFWPNTEITLAILAENAKPETRADIQGADDELAEQVSHAMRKYCAMYNHKIKILTNAEVRAEQAARQLSGEGASAVEIGKNLKADYVLELKINSISIYSKNFYPPFYQGNTDIAVRLYKVEDAAGNSKVYSKDYQRTYPEASGPIAADSMSPATFRGAFLSKVGNDVAKLFLAHPPEEKQVLSYYPPRNIEATKTAPANQVTLSAK